MRLSEFVPAAVILALIPTAAGAADGTLVDELRFGVYQHDASVFGHQKETGADIGAELLFASPQFLKPVYAPRPVVGFLANTAGETNQVYMGLTWTWDFVRDVLRPGDGFYVEGTLGGGWNDGKTNVRDPAEQDKHKSLGSHFLFREDVDLGYRVSPAWSVAISYNHISNADLASRNEGLNDIGLRVGYRF
jgi:lipid A 3-O-deacylase